MHHTKKIIGTATAAALLLAGGMSSAVAEPSPRITICHRTGSESNPYVKMTISENAWHAHERHPAKNGRVDFKLSSPADSCATTPPPPPVNDDGDCDASGNSTQSQQGLVNVGNLNLGGDNLRASAFCQADVHNGLDVTLIGPAIGGPSLGSGLLAGGPLGLLSDAPGYLLSGLTTDVRVLANVLVQL